MVLVAASFKLVCEFIDSILEEYKISITVVPDNIMHGRTSTIEFSDDTGMYMLAFSDKLTLKVYSEYILHNIAHIIDWEKHGKPSKIEDNHRKSWDSEFRLLKKKYHKYTHNDNCVCINGEII